MKAILVTGRSLDQGLGKELGKFSRRYSESIVLCEMSSKDMEKLGIKSGDFLRIKTNFGSVDVRVIESRQTLPSGVIFIPYGSWVNSIVNSKTHGTGMPSFKGIVVDVEIISR